MLCPQCHAPLDDRDPGPPICCAGASRQWHCRQCGGLREAFAFPYRRCPECGGELVLRDGSQGPGSASMIAIRTAFEIELGGRAFYQRAAAQTQDESLKALFRGFAVMEGEHMERLSRRYHVADIPPSAPEFRVELAALFAGVDHRPQDADNLFRIAIALEQRAAGFFASRSTLAPPGSAERQLYQELAEEEREHAQTLSTAYQRWRQDGAAAPLAGTAADDRTRAAALAEPINAAELLLAHSDPDAIALVCGDQLLTYGELRDRVARAAHVWHDRGLTPGDRVAIKLPDGIDWVVAFLGTIWAGGVAVAVNPQIPAPEWQYILEEAGFNVILAETADDTPAPWHDCVMLVDEGRRAVADAAPIEPHRVDEDTPAFWCHSSGTSGKPKAVVHRHGFAREIERVSRERLGITGADRLFATSRLFFSYPQTNSLFAGLKLGATVILDPQWPTAASAAAMVAQMRPTVFFSVPSLYRNLLHAGLAPSLAANGVRLCVSAGETLPASLREAWQNATGLGMVDGYGASETLVLVLTGKAGDDGLQASPGVEVHPLDPEAAAAGHPDAPAHPRFDPGPGLSRSPGGAGRNLPRRRVLPGRPVPAHRRRRLALCRPRRLAGQDQGPLGEPGRTRGALAAGAPGLLEAGSVCVPDQDGVDSVNLFFVAREGQAAEVERVLLERAAAMPPYQRPSAMHAIAALPRTPTGKLLRRKLAELLPLGGARPS